MFTLAYSQIVPGSAFPVRLLYQVVGNMAGLEEVRSGHRCLFEVVALILVYADGDAEPAGLVGVKSFHQPLPKYGLYRATMP